MSLKTKEKIRCKGCNDEGIPSFIRKTYDILQEGQHEEIIKWSDDGTAIIIRNPTDFAEKVLPIYFKHNNLTSFVRQLNMYNFHKKRSPNLEHIYYHELFQRNKRNLLKEIRRKNSENTLAQLEKSLAGLDSMANKDDQQAVAQENILLKKLNKEALSKIGSLEAKIKELTKENNILWKKIHEKQNTSDNFKSSLCNLIDRNGIVDQGIQENLRNEFNLPNINNMSSELNYKN